MCLAPVQLLLLALPDTINHIPVVKISAFNPRVQRHYYSATSNNEVGTLGVDGWVVTFGTASRGMGGARPARSPLRPLLAVPNVTAHPLKPSVPITVLLYNGPLL